MTKITGQALLQHRTNCLAQGMTAGEIVRSAGYAVQRKDGSERLQFTEYYENILIAKGEMFRIKIDVAEFTPQGLQPVWGYSFTTTTNNPQSIARKVRELTQLTNVKCNRTVKDGVIRLQPKGTNEIIAYTLPA